MSRVLTACLLLSVLACGEPPNKSPTPTPTTGAMIAAIDGERMDSTYAKRADYLLSNIASWCSDSVSEERVGDMAANVKSILRDDFGLDRDILDILEEVNDSVSVAPVPLTCAEIFALYTIFSGQ